MKRRRFLGLVTGATAFRLTAAADRAGPLIGYLGPSSADAFASRVRAFQQGLGEAGFTEGKNVATEYRWADSHYERFPALAADLVRLKVSVIVAGGSTPAALAAKAATQTIPIVFLTAADPVQIGLVSSLNRPGGNATGVTVLSTDLGPKQLEWLRELAPKAKVIGLLVNPDNAAVTAAQSRLVGSAASSMGLTLHIVSARSEAEFDRVFAKLVQLRADALVITGETLFTSQSAKLAELALRHGLPAVYQFREFAAAGGLLSYGADLMDAHRLTGVYTGKVLKGMKPADLPVQQSEKLHLAINLKTARAFGITVPKSLLGLADEVIQ